VSDEEIERVALYWKERAVPDLHEEIVAPKTTHDDGEAGWAGDDSRLLEARELVVHAGKASASFLQRRMSIGYARAARLLDLLEDEGTIGPGEGAKPRDVLLRVEDLHTQEYPMENEESVSDASDNTDDEGRGN